MPNQRRTTVRRAPVQSRRRRTSRAQTWFSVVALLTVVAMLIGAVGSAVVLDVFDDDPDQIDVNPDDLEDPIEADYRADYAANSDDPQVVARLANYVRQGRGGGQPNYDEAIALFEEALDLAPDDLGIRLDFADTLVAAGSNRDAELQYLRVVEADSSIEFGGRALLDLAQLYRDWDPPRTDEAIDRYDEVLMRYPMSVYSELAQEDLIEMGVATPAPASSPAASPPAVTAP